ncbi:murein L,D-transpeptidase catalytic domain family protein [Bacteroides sp. 51]|uniref:murein L,D-transpeptidase catalytic domain family protein n=1 Tax=Bacteroides sp. 51 TaxID=2302938 RepID=UPI0013D1A88A|nr:murein L,D-transpeptidase catalytic domain family protein [Bacteroides sp. 51]NDV84819.1 hypothetical protein [Bacteroides sp. 51]
MRKLFLIILLFAIRPVSYSVSEERTAIHPSDDIDPYQLYAEMELENTINYVAFQQAVIGYNKIQEKKKDIITLIDFTKPSSEERFYVFNVKQKKLLFTSVVSHGRNSGDLYTTSFSNKNGSYKSSLGFFITQNTYQGRNGYSLVLDGLEKGINDRAKQRAIVIHGASYSNPSVIASSGRLGRSLGCPALPQGISRRVINTIKDGSLLYIYANNRDYLAQSTFFSVPAERG